VKYRTVVADPPWDLKPGGPATSGSFAVEGCGIDSC
jgi:hypothetical protein